MKRRWKDAKSVWHSLSIQKCATKGVSFVHMFLSKLMIWCRNFELCQGLNMPYTCNRERLQPNLMEQRTRLLNTIHQGKIKFFMTESIQLWKLSVWLNYQLYWNNYKLFTTFHRSNNNCISRLTSLSYYFNLIILFFQQSEIVGH